MPLLSDKSSASHDNKGEKGEKDIIQHTSNTSTIFNNGRYTTNITTDPHTHTTTDIKTNMRHIHTSIISRHLATRGNNKIYCAHLHHTLAALKRYFPASLVASLPNSEQINHPSSNHIYTQVDANHIHQHPHGNTHTHDTHHLFNCTHIVTPGFVDRPRRND